jgi:hypothetical protein
MSVALNSVIPLLLAMAGLLEATRKLAKSDSRVGVTVAERKEGLVMRCSTT